MVRDAFVRTSVSTGQNLQSVVGHCKPKDRRNIVIVVRPEAPKNTRSVADNP